MTYLILISVAVVSLAFGWVIGYTMGRKIGYTIGEELERRRHPTPDQFMEDYKRDTVEGLVAENRYLRDKR